MRMMSTQKGETSFFYLILHQVDEKFVSFYLISIMLLLLLDVMLVVITSTLICVAIQNSKK